MKIQALEDRCSGCGSPRPNYKCSACKFYAFCKKECQVEEWDRPGHKMVCHNGGLSEVPLPIGSTSTNAVELVCRALEHAENLRDLDLAHFWQKNVIHPTRNIFPDLDEADDAANEPNEDEEERLYQRHVYIFLDAQTCPSNFFLCGLARGGPNQKLLQRLIEPTTCTKKNVFVAYVKTITLRSQ